MQIIELLGNPLELPLFDNFEEFAKWYQSLVPDEPLNLTEAATTFYNLDFYNY